MNASRPELAKSSFATLVVTLPDDPPTHLEEVRAFVDFDQWVSSDLARLEEHYRSLATPDSLRMSLGR